MALLFVDGFDAGDYAVKWSVINGGTTSTPGRYGTGRYMYLPGGGQTISKLFTASSQVFIGFALNLDLNFNGNFLSLSGDNGTVSHLGVAFSSTQISINRNGVTLATAATVSPINGWSYIEVMATINDVTGTCKVRVDGVELINFTGDTRNGGTNQTIDMVTLVRPPSGGNSRFDDFYLCDGTGSAPYNAFLGDIRINTIVPTGAGSDTGFTPSTGANYTTVDELPYSATDFVTGTTTGTRDLYTMGDLSGSYTVLAVQNNLIAKKTDAGTTSIKTAIKSVGTI